MSHAFWSQHRHSFGPLQPPPSYQILVADNPAVTPKGTIWLPLTFTDERTGETMTHIRDFAVVKGLTDEVIVGMDVINKFFQSVDFRTGEPTFHKVQSSNGIEMAPMEFRSLHLQRKLTLAPRSTARVLVTFSAVDHLADGATLLVQPIALSAQDGTPCSLDFADHLQQDGKSYVLTVTNTTPHRLEMSKNTIIGRVGIVEPSGIHRLVGYRAVRHARMTPIQSGSSFLHVRFPNSRLK